MSRNSHRKRKKRRVKPVRFFSTEWFRKAVSLMDEYDGFDWDGRAGTFSVPAGARRRPTEEIVRDFCHHDFEVGSCFACALGTARRKRLRRGVVFLMGLAVVVGLVTLAVYVSFRR